jgi:AraC-like DNA-binding protein
VVAAGLEDADTAVSWEDEFIIQAQRVLDRSGEEAGSPRLSVGVAWSIADAKEIGRAYWRARRASELAIHHESRRVFRHDPSVEEKADEWSAAAERLGSFRGGGPEDASSFLRLELGKLDGCRWIDVGRFNELKAYCHSILTLALGQSCRLSASTMVRVGEQLRAATSFGELKAVTAETIEKWQSGELDASIGSPTVRAIHAFVRSRLDEPLSLSDIAAEVRLSPSYVSTLFRQETGTSLVRFIAQQKVDRAMQLLRGDDYLPVSEVAARLGFSDYRYFTRVFKRLTGETPTEFVRSNRGRR